MEGLNNITQTQKVQKTIIFEYFSSGTAGSLNLNQQIFNRSLVFTFSSLNPIFCLILYRILRWCLLIPVQNDISFSVEFKRYAILTFQEVCLLATKGHHQLKLFHLSFFKYFTKNIIKSQPKSD